MHTNQGHRKRTRDRFLAEGLESFDEVHALELILFYALAQKDTKPLARALLDRFGTFNGVLEAPVEELTSVPGVGEGVATYLSLFNEVERYRRVRKDSMFRVMDTVDKYGRYLASQLSGRRNETVFILCLDAKQKMLCCKMVGEGDVNSASIPVRRIVEIALATNASMVILAHNHPSGSAVPSPEDVMTTKAFGRALLPLGVVLADHVVVSDDDFTSMRQSHIYNPEKL